MDKLKVDIVESLMKALRVEKPEIDEINSEIICPECHGYKNLLYRGDDPDSLITSKKCDFCRKTGKLDWLQQIINGIDHTNREHINT